jgi:hypothetical protein
LRTASRTFAESGFVPGTGLGFPAAYAGLIRNCEAGKEAAIAVPVITAVRVRTVRRDTGGVSSEAAGSGVFCGVFNWPSLS